MGRSTRRALRPFLALLLISIKVVEIEAVLASRLGCDVFILDFLPVSSDTGKLDRSAFRNTTVTQIVNNGFDNPLTKYAWSSALTPNGEFCVGTMSNNMRAARLTTLMLQILLSPNPYVAWLDMALRFTSGSQIAYSEGGEVWCTTSKDSGSMVGPRYHDFVQVFKAPADFVGFRKMIEYKGKIYAGAANGPDGPDLIGDVNLDGLEFTVDDLLFMDFNASADYAANPRFKTINPYFSNSIQQDIYGPEQPAHAKQGAALFSGWPNGTGWTNLVSDTLTTWDRSVRAMCVSSYSNRLFVGTESLNEEWNGTGAKILVMSDDVTNNLTILNRLPTVAAVSSCTELEPGKMIFGLWGHPEKRHLAVLDETNGDVLTVVDNTKLATFHKNAYGAIELRIFKQYLYVGIFDNFGGTFTLVRTNDLTDLTNTTNWEVITNNGFATQQRKQFGRVLGRNIFPWSSEVVGDIYYIGTRVQNFGTRLDSRAQLWASSDGSNWIMLDGKAFGQAKMNGFRTMQSDGTRLYIGATSSLFTPVLTEQPYDKLDLIPRKPMKLIKPFYLIHR